MFRFTVARKRLTEAQLKDPPGPFARRGKAHGNFPTLAKPDAPASLSTRPAADRQAMIDHPIIDEVRAALRAAYRRGLSCSQSELGRRVLFLEAEVERLDTAISELQRRATILVKVRNAASEVVSVEPDLLDDAINDLRAVLVRCAGGSVQALPPPED